MRSLEFIILLSKYNRTLNRFLIIETSLIDCSLRNIRLNDMELAQMPSAFTFLAYTLVWVVMAKVRFCQFISSLIEDIIIV